MYWIYVDRRTTVTPECCNIPLVQGMWLIAVRKTIPGIARALPIVGW